MSLYNKGLRPHDLDPQDASGNGITQLTGDVTAGPGSGSKAATITNGAVTYAKVQNVGASSLLGNLTGGAHVVEEITLESRLNFVGSVLTLTLALPAAVLVANLLATPIAQQLALVSDATAPAIGVAVTGGGALNALVCHIGSSWIVI